MKFVVTFDPKTFKTDSFRYDEPGPVPPVVAPEKPEEAKDGGAPTPEKGKTEKSNTR